MKKTLLLAIGALSTCSVFGQSLVQRHELTNFGTKASMPAATVAARTTSVHIVDSLELLNFPATDTPYYYYYGTNHDSGYVGGINFIQSAAFAERYWFNSVDTSVKVIGVAGLFTGHKNSASTKFITFRAWTPSGVLSSSRPTLSFSGLPDTLIDTVNVPLTSMYLDTALTVAYFASPTAFMMHPFFVGYSINYTWGSLGGDTIGLYSTRNGVRTIPEFIISAGDTTVNNVCVRADTSGGGYVWEDMAYNLGANFDWFIFPIVDMQYVPENVHSISTKNLTFYGNYPNPAVNSTNIKFSLVNSADVEVSITDMSGRTIKTIRKNNLSAGDNVIALETAELPAGNYLCTLHTSLGGGVANKLTIAK